MPGCADHIGKIMSGEANKAARG